MQRLLTVLILFGCALGAYSQTISPVLSEYRLKAEGRFRVTNDMLTNVNVVLEPKSFRADEKGNLEYSSLDPGIHVKLSEKSFRLAPKQSRTLTYKATASNLPSWFVIYADVTGAPVRKTSGMNIEVMLPHTVYILPNEDAKENELSLKAARYNPASHLLTLEVASTSVNFARVELTSVKTDSGSLDARGFPLYPGKSREIEIPIQDGKTPREVTLELKSFKLKSTVTQQ